MKAKEYPTIDVETKYGKLQMTFMSPCLEMQEQYVDNKRVKVANYPAARLNGELKINGVEIDVSMGCKYGTAYYKEGEAQHCRSSHAPQREPNGSSDFSLASAVFTDIPASALSARESASDAIAGTLNGNTSSAAAQRDARTNGLATL